MKIFGHTTYVGTTGYNSHARNFFRALSKNNQVKIRNFTIGKDWKGMNGDAKPNENPHGNDVDNLDKELIAQQSLWTHGVLMDYNIYNGLKDFDHDVNIILAECDHHYLYQNYNGPKIFYTVWENTLYPESSIEQYKKYDQIWVPSKWQADITIRQGVDPDKVKVIPEGVDISTFYPENLKYDDDKFRFLIFGRWDDRKSTVDLIRAFKNVFGNSNKVELVISVDNYFSVDGLKTTEERLNFYNFDSDNIKVLHFPEKKDYVDYLKRGHVFLSCARSEGWNLPLIEAMACGIPAIYSNCSGQLEFAEGKGISVEILKEVPVAEIEKSFSGTFYKTGNWYQPDYKDLETKILEVYNNYNFYKNKALLDSEIIRKEFTWDNAAKKAELAIKQLNKFKNKENFSINYLGLTEDKFGIYYTCTSEQDVLIKVEIVDEFTGLVFYKDSFFVNNKTKYFTKHAYPAPNQIFKIYDANSNKLKLEQKINIADNINFDNQKDFNKNIVSLIPDNLKDHKSLGFSYFEIFFRNIYSYGKCKVDAGDIVFDLGSCFGLFSRFAFQNGASEVHAFEPNEELIECNLNLNKGFKLFFNSKAVSSKKVKFFKNENLIESSVKETDENNSISINFNDYIKHNNISKIDFLKVDIEDSEYDLFDSIDENFLLKNISKIVIEYHNNKANRINDILSKLNRCGFVYEFELKNGKDLELGILYAWKNKQFDFDSFFAKYKNGIISSGYSRYKFYEYIIPRLVARNKPLYILETGTMWEPFKTNAGAFTLIMADLIKNVTGGKLFSVDVSEKSINACKKNTEGFHDAIEFVLSDSVSFLNSLSDDFVFKLDLVYLDSYDLYLPDTHASASHHLAELNAVYDRINNDCGIAIDDNFLPGCWVEWRWYNPDGSISKTEIININDAPRGKGQYCNEKLLSKGWKRFEEFDDFPNSCLFYYERKKFTKLQVDKILKEFYEKNKIEKPKTDKFLNIDCITNGTASGLGDALILHNLSKYKFIHSSYCNFSALEKYNDNYKELPFIGFFDINTSDINLFDWGGGHCIQRLEKAFIGKCDSVPKPYLNKEYKPIKNKVCLHLEGYSFKLDDETKNFIIESVKKLGFSIYFWDPDETLDEAIENISTCEYFLGVNSGPMHLAAAFGIKSIIVIQGLETDRIYLPKLEEVNVKESEWLYPQNVHLSVTKDNELIEMLSFANIKKAFDGKLYPYFSLDFIPKEQEINITFNYKPEESKLEFVINESIEKINIVLQELNTNLKCYDLYLENFQKDIVYFIIPTLKKNLASVDFSGFVFSIYKENKLIYKTNIKLTNVKNNDLKFYSDPQILLDVSDNFYVQHLDFYKNSFLNKIIKENSIILDVGASCGTFAYNCLYKNPKQIFCLEPSRSFAILEKTFKNIFNVSCLNVALSDSNDEKLFFSSKSSTLSSFHNDLQTQFDSENYIKDVHVLNVKCTTLNNLRKQYNIDKIDLFKLDIEGHEYDVFKSFDSESLKNVDSVLIEFHHNIDNKIKIITDVLKKFNFDFSFYKINYLEKSNGADIEGVIYAVKNKNLIKIPVSIGEIVDKITILKIKKQKIPAFSNEIDKEIKMLEETLSDYPIENSFFDSLTEINSKLWITEDSIRLKEQSLNFDTEFIELARNVYKTNDERSKVKSQINKFYSSQIHEYKFHSVLEKKTIRVINDSSSLGDAIAWMGAVANFAIQNSDCIIDYYTPHKNLFQKEYPQINFYDYSEKEQKQYSPENSFLIGCFEEKKWKRQNLQEIACSILKIKYEENKPKIFIPNKNKFSFSEKYVCIAVQSTSQSRYWNNLTGWDEVVNYLHNLGYKVVCVDKYDNYGSDQYINKCPAGVDYRLLGESLEDVTDVISKCEFFIGLSSGLSWLAWALNKEVVLISGSVEPFFEFKNEFRVFNDKICFGCFNDVKVEFNRNFWSWCPSEKTFECSRLITFDMVKNKIDLCLNKINKTNQVTLINFVTNSLGDNIAFSPYPSEYQKKYGGTVYVSSIWHNIFHSDNPNVHFISKETNINYDKKFDICFRFIDCPIQQLICEDLNIEYKEILPAIKPQPPQKRHKRKYVCISTHSTSQCKYWNNETGWDKVVRYLNRMGYDVICIDKYEVFGIEKKWNKIPDACINKTGDIPIEKRIHQIQNCEFFVGLSSGLSWLAWALNKKVIMISGCTTSNNEFLYNNYRVLNSSVCHGCLNDSSIDNVKGIVSGWLYCPRNKNFECTKEISFEMVKDKINECIKDLNYKK